MRREERETVDHIFEEFFCKYKQRNKQQLGLEK